MAKTALIIFAREPIDGKVKTRLGKSLPASDVTELYKAFIRDVAGTALKAQCTQRFIYYAADGAPIPFLQGFEEHFRLRPQEGLDLGERMHRAFEDCRKSHFGRVIVIGTDCVTLTAEDIETAFAKLADHDCVLGPSADGGYYLIGLKRADARIFTGIPWGTPKVLDQTIRRTGELGKITFLLRDEADVDTPEDLKALSRRIKGKDIAPCTQAALETLGK